ncbi:MAG: hypothetical protein OXE43_09405 [Chloroflexi bacterium]|nr:hypothetical protein [Chloroflexota bacterium]
MSDRPFPVLNGSVWWRLRSAFQRSLPREVTPTYLATVLSTEDDFAKNVLRNLRLLGLVGEESAPTELAIRWRDDEQYAGACQDIAKLVYPDELLSAAPGPEADAKTAAQWFQRSRLLGQGAAKNAARTYVLITSATLPTEDGRTPTKKGTVAKDGSTSKRPRATGTRKPPSEPTPRGFEQPRPQIAVQVNIAPDMTPEQIDQVFASMAKHFYSEAVTE